MRAATRCIGPEIENVKAGSAIRGTNYWGAVAILSFGFFSCGTLAPIERSEFQDLYEAEAPANPRDAGEAAPVLHDRPGRTSKRTTDRDAFAGGRYSVAAVAAKWGSERAAGLLSFNLEGMGLGSAALRLVIQNEQWDLGPMPLEIGPFYTPILQVDPNRHVVYWERDSEAIATLTARQEKLRSVAPDSIGKVDYVHVDLNRLVGPRRAKFIEANRNLLQSAQGDGFSAIVISQVLNYVNFRELLDLVAELQAPSGLLFIVNGTDVGDQDFFHPARPKSNQDI